MKAVRAHRFGGPEVLTYEEAPVPEPGEGEVLVRVHAAGLNPPDWYARSGFVNIAEELRPVVDFPFTPGTDISGVVTAAGPGVTEWHPGDEVFGLLRFPSLHGRGYAEYTTAPATDLARKPATLDHVRAAAVPMSALTAYQYLNDIIKLEPGKSVLVNGAAGGVGHFAVQLAKLRDTTVTAVASGRHAEFLGSLGADRFLDYTTSDVAAEIDDADHLIDCVGGPEAYRLVPALRDGGVVSPVFNGEFHRDEAARRGITFAGGQVHSDGRQLAEIAALIDQGVVRPGIDSVFPLAEAARAHTRAEQGHLQGKIVLAVA